VELVKVEQSISFTFCLSSKGGGVTEVKVEIGPDDFAAIISVMINADRGRAMRDIASALATELANQPDYDKTITRQARESVAKAALHAYQEAPSGRDHAERLVSDVVRQLVETLNNADEATEVTSEHPLSPQKG
jgi:hypothetical protein